jgi:hypothetical protein
VCLVPGFNHRDSLRKMIQAVVCRINGDAQVVF